MQMGKTELWCTIGARLFFNVSKKCATIYTERGETDGGNGSKKAVLRILCELP